MISKFYLIELVGHVLEQSSVEFQCLYSYKSNKGIEKSREETWLDLQLWDSVTVFTPRLKRKQGWTLNFASEHDE
ncbi:hypothetical protein SADUNF_Sadunf02G0007800 [Salix dunnii]|uniref:Uncharacterized protein n=1 Tax=Salix dunnii TaxID=1413687 RepID=A0A835N5E1_9ROSI|nr:hypothetical protein SADUNF_Sadunf02G0007800 [Salix dunnii]